MYRYVQVKPQDIRSNKAKETIHHVPHTHLSMPSFVYHSFDQARNGHRGAIGYMIFFQLKRKKNQQTLCSGRGKSILTVTKSFTAYPVQPWVRRYSTNNLCFQIKITSATTECRSVPHITIRNILKFFQFSLTDHYIPWKIVVIWLKILKHFGLWFMDFSRICINWNYIIPWCIEWIFNPLVKYNIILCWK